MEKPVLLEKPGGKPPPNRPALVSGNYYDNFLENTTIFWRRLFGNVHGHSKNLLDFKRPITRSGPLSIF